LLVALCVSLLRADAGGAGIMTRKKVLAVWNSQPHQRSATGPPGMTPRPSWAWGTLTLPPRHPSSAQRASRRDRGQHGAPHETATNRDGGTTTTRENNNEIAKTVGPAMDLPRASWEPINRPRGNSWVLPIISAVSMPIAPVVSPMVAVPTHPQPPATTWTGDGA
jgi:hypothetical protein